MGRSVAGGVFAAGFRGVASGRVMLNPSVKSSLGDERPLMVCLKAPFRGSKNKFALLPFITLSLAGPFNMTARAIRRIVVKKLFGAYDYDLVDCHV